MPEQVIISEPAPFKHSASHADHTLHWLAVGTALAAGAIILSPYLLPLVHIGQASMAGTAMSMLHDPRDLGLGTGLAGFINKGLNSVPLIGSKLAEGGLFSAAVSGGFGLGGLLLSRFVEKRENGESKIKWSKVILYGALLTSAMVALPSVLTGISAGITFLSLAFSPTSAKLANAAAIFFGNTLGSIGTASKGALLGNTASSIVPHLLTCGGALLPAIAPWFFIKHKENSQHESSKYSEKIFTSVEDQVSWKKNPSSVSSQIELLTPLDPGKPCTLKMTLIDNATHSPITPDDLATVHTEKIHMLIADESLKDYHHVHPHTTGEPGVYSCSFVPNTSNGYHVWSDITLANDSERHKILTDIPSPLGRKISPVISFNSSAQADGLTFTWHSHSLLQANAPSIIEVDVADAAGNPVRDLQPVMGTFAHLVGFGKDGKSLIHTHPLDAHAMADDALGGPKLRFQIEPEIAGAAQFYLHAKRYGKEIYVPFGQPIKAPAKATERATMHHHSARYI